MADVFAVEIGAPDLSDWRQGNIGVPYCVTVSGPVAGPHLVVVAAIHGNELAGAIALDHLLRAPPSLLRGRLTGVFANPHALAAFDPLNPTATRYLDEDLNRVWDEATLGGCRRSRELDRARELLPVVTSADMLLDVHSMLWPSEPLVLCGPSERGRALALRMGMPWTIVADSGHAMGRRLIDHAHFTGAEGQATAVLVEGGQHWLAETVAACRVAIDAALAASGLVEGAAANRPGRVAEVTLAVTAETGRFRFVRDFRGGDVLRRAGTLVALDGEAEIRTTHDDCLIVMPSLRPTRGHTAVRLARFVADSEWISGPLFA